MKPIRLSGRSKYSKWLVFLFFPGLLSPVFCQAQLKYSERFLYAMGGGFYNSFMVSRLGVNPQGPGFDSIPAQSFAISFLSLSIEGRYNLVQLGSALSLSMESGASLGFGITIPTEDLKYGNAGLGSVSFPAMASLNIGQSATRSSRIPLGIVFGMGWEGNVTPVIATNTKAITRSPQFWIVPAFKAGLRVTTVGMPVEFNIRFGKQRNPDLFIDPLGNTRYFRAGSFHWNLIVWINPHHDKRPKQIE